MKEQVEQKVYDDINRIKNDCFSEKEEQKYRKELIKDAKLVKTSENLIDILAETKDKYFYSALKQSQFYMDLQMFDNKDKKIEYLEAGNGKKYESAKRDKEKAVKESFRNTLQLDVKREIYHKELEKRLGYEFNLGQNEFMTMKIIKDVMKR